MAMPGCLFLTMHIRAFLQLFHAAAIVYLPGDDLLRRRASEISAIAMQQPKGIRVHEPLAEVTDDVELADSPAFEISKIARRRFRLECKVFDFF